MSKNNQYLVKKHGGMYHVFDVPAESWDEKNILNVKDSLGSFKTHSEAHHYAHTFDTDINEWSEYGVVDEILAKDGAEVHIHE